MQCPFDCQISPLPVSLPLSIKPLKELLKPAKKCLGNNFTSSFITIVGTVIVFHYESIMDIQDECPLIMCYSRESRTGMISLMYIQFLNHKNRKIHITAKCS